MTPAINILEIQFCIANNSDEVAFRRLYDFIGSRLIQFSYSILKSTEMAEEVVSDVFVKIWQQRERLTKINNLTVYLYTATKNTSLDYLKKYRKKETLQLEDYHIEFGGFAYTPEDLLITAEIMASIEKAIQQLPPKCKTIFKLIKEDNLKYKEVADILSISLKTVEYQMSIALEKLKVSIQTDTPQGYLSNPQRISKN